MLNRTVTPLVALVIAAGLAAFLPAADSGSILIRNVTIHPVTAPEIKGSSLLIVDGKIAEIGPKISPKSAATVIDGHGLHLYPGMINGAATVGLVEISSIRDTVDLDEIGLFNPQLKAEIAFNPSSEHIPIVRAAGITTVLSLPSSGSGVGLPGEGASIITGQASLMHLDGWTWEQMVLKRGAALDMIFPEIRTPSPALRVFLGTQARPFTEIEKEYRQKLEQMSTFFEDARRYAKAKAAGGADFKTDLKLEAMIPVIEGKRPIFIRAEKERAIKDAVQFAEMEKVKIIIADPHELGSTAALLKQHDIPVVLGKVLSLPLNEDDAYDAQYALPGQLYKAGVKFCFGTFDTEFARNVPFEAAAGVGFGLPRDEALKGVTINAAEIFGVADKVGSIEKGKVADLILTDGDPLEAKTNIKGMYIEGKPVSLESRHTRLYEKWMARP
jgi:imidazolonepropionase-like amidohydrolase